MTSLGEAITAEADEARGVGHAFGFDWQAERFDDQFKPARIYGNDRHRYVAETMRAPAAAHIARCDPARALRVATSHLQILARHERNGGGGFVYCDWCSNVPDAVLWPCPDVISLAAVYGLAPHEIEP